MVNNILKKKTKKIKLTYFKEVEWSFQIAVSIDSYKKKEGGMVNNVQNSRIHKKKDKRAPPTSKNPNGYSK